MWYVGWIFQRKINVSDDADMQDHAEVEAQRYFLRHTQVRISA